MVLRLPTGERMLVFFYAFFKNKNDNSTLFVEVEKWWIEAHKLDYFEKTVKIKEMILGNK
jgi:hypothetical protein